MTTHKPTGPDAPPAPEKADPFEGLVPGRIVHYQPREYESRHCSPGPWAAIVTLVRPDGVININVQMPTPAPVGTDPVCRMVDVKYSEAHEGGCWSWVAKA